MLCLQDLLQTNERPQFVSIESEQSSLFEQRRELATLKQLGYTRFQIVDQGQVPKQRLAYPTKEGAYVPYHFDLGASGQFGRDLPDRWMSSTATFAKFMQIYARNKLLGLSTRFPLPKSIASRFQGSWYDIYAAL